MEISPDLSVIIVSWNVRDHLLRCLDALLSEPVKGDLSLEIIVVDNASSDSTIDAIQGYPLIVIANSKNVGYGRANNQGFRAAKGRHLLVLNPDTIPQPGAPARLLDFQQSHPKAGIVSPRLLNPDGTVQVAAFTFPTLPMAFLDLFPLPAFIPGRLRRRLETSRLNGRYSQERTESLPFRIDHPLGACLLVSREAYEQCGGFSEDIFIYSEEIDLALRYRTAGWECWQVPGARVVHQGGQSTSQMPERMFVELWRSRLYIYSRYYTGRQQTLLRALLRIAMTRYTLAARLRSMMPGSQAVTDNSARRARAILRMLNEK